jgi:DnaJ-class molecular chaperone
MTLKLKTGVTCPICDGNGFTEDAVPTEGDTSVTCETCSGSGHVPAKWATMYAYSMDKTCDYCGGLKGAAWDGESFACVECWEQKHASWPVIE